jgi:hypothetical protein
VRSREIGNRPLDIRHSRAAIPASGQMGPNLGSTTGFEFAIRGQEQVLIRQV